MMTGCKLQYGIHLHMRTIVVELEPESVATKKSLLPMAAAQHRLLRIVPVPGNADNGRRAHNVTSVQRLRKTKDIFEKCTFLPRRLLLAMAAGWNVQFVSSFRLDHVSHLWLLSCNIMGPCKIGWSKAESIHNLSVYCWFSTRSTMASLNPR